jgi:HPt (histidine-containing phosphotransfer) domain-containing protein
MRDHHSSRTVVEIETELLQLAEALGGEEARQILDMFLEDSLSRLERLSRAVQTADDATARQEAHSLKGAAGSVGATSLWNICAGVESDVRAVDWYRAASDVAELRQCLCEVQGHFDGQAA